jgi:thioredoxin reductase/bacterioferritin-associated ferredoxin
MTDDLIPISFDGRPLAARRGESLLAALTAAGEYALRSTPDGHARGAFCGMGVCQECLVTIDGRPGQRACMAKVEGPAVVTRSAGAIGLESRPAASPRRAADLPLLEPELLVVGAGPAGLAAALAAARCGLKVLVVDERSAPGGQYFKPLAVDAPSPGPDRQHEAGAALVADVRRAGATLRTGTSVWGAFPGPEFACADAEGSFRVRPAAAILATGAYERAWHVPGWTEPGVMTTGAAQTLWRASRRLPGRRVLIAGNGPLNLQLGAELLAGGADIVALVEAAPPPGTGSIAAAARMALAAPALVRDGLGYLSRLRRADVPTLHSSTVVAIERCGTELAVSIGGPAPATLRADSLCLGYGLLPSNELARTLGCAFHPDPVAGCLVPVRDPDGQSSLPGVFLVGDGVRMGGAHAALAEGRLAGLAIAQGRGCAVDPIEIAQARETLARHRSFQRGLWSIYAPAQPLAPATTPDTILCRCEGVLQREIGDAIAQGYVTAGAIKQQTRLGMGRCQGRYCGEALQRLLPGGDEHAGFAPRVPVRPVTVGALAS